MEASHKNHRPHIKVGKDAEEEEDNDNHPFSHVLHSMPAPIEHSIVLFVQ